MTGKLIHQTSASKGSFLNKTFRIEVFFFISYAVKKKIGKTSSGSPDIKSLSAGGRLQAAFDFYASKYIPERTWQTLTPNFLQFPWKLVFRGFFSNVPKQCLELFFYLLEQWFSLI